MKRAILVLMVVVFALVTVVPTFAMSQDFHGIIMEQSDEMKGLVDPNIGVIVPQIVDPNVLVDPNDGSLKNSDETMEAASDGRSYVTGY
jgi:hypothetical protein